MSTDSLVNRYASEKKTYSTFKIDDRIKIDGDLDELCWSVARWDDSFVQQQPLQAKQPSQKTEVALCYDEDNLYVGIRCFDNDSKGIRSILSRRDEYSGDMIGIALDTYADNRTAFEFDVTAAGQKIDLMHLGAQEADYNWDAIWDAKTNIQDSLWTAEIRIPFSQLRFAKSDEQTWGMHIWRYIDRSGEEIHWKLIPVDAPATVYLFGELNGVKNIGQKRKIELLPYGNVKYSPNTDLKEKWKFGAGLDGKIGLSSDFTMDFTINPDFGQVEADPSILSLNTYEVFYDEKRPFFLEGNNVLNYSSGRDLLFYSRRIGHAPSLEPSVVDGETLSIPDNTSILSAIKLTGKSKDGLSVGFLHSLTGKETASVYNTDSVTDYAVEPLTNYTVGRIKQDFNDGNTVLGGMITSVNRNINDSLLSFLPNSSLTGGLDFVHNWRKRKYFIDMKSFFSQVKGSEEAISDLQQSSQHYYQRPDADHLEYDDTRKQLSGHGGEVRGGKRSGKFRAIGSFSWRSPGIDLNDIGYMYQADYLEESVELRYLVNKPKGIMRNYWLRLTQSANWSYGGEQTKQEIGSHAYMRFKNLWSIHLNLERDYDIFDTRELRGGPILYKEPTWDSEIFIQSNPSKDLFAAGGTRFIWGDDKISLRNINTFYLLWRLGENLSLSSKTVYQTNTDYHQYAGRVKLPDGNPGYIVGQVDQKTLESTLRLEYFITPEFSLQYYASPYASIGKYKDFRRVNIGSSRDLNERYINLAGSLDDDIYTFTEENNGSYRMYNPDFTFKEFNSNLVARWEFRAGSTFYFVWNNTISDYQRGYDPSLGNVFSDIFGADSQNVFMLKFTYWFAL
ncbi:DUF5916 domain-containing protein [Mangrovibacterium lignilyticum]|uniref:DUF5916 domain-containing protein n=1 Tax=Mangrovibacterium lignilyticum TaxID=2668052 RepID=UPI00196852BE|nr:DUF5916 domain-containing protein [Mangrovibacterium lignilyticum]